MNIYTLSSAHSVMQDRRRQLKNEAFSALAETKSLNIFLYICLIQSSLEMAKLKTHSGKLDAKQPFTVWKH